MLLTMATDTLLIVSFGLIDVLRLSVSLVTRTVWLIVGPIINYLWKSFLHGLIRYGLAMCVFLGFLFWALRQDPEA